jgi:HD-like signal output (HDOD) protein/ActR/RegA family two-component response regulator
MESQRILKRILFVDDEPHLLAGLRRSLRGQRGEWEMFFAASGEEALSLIEEAPMDAVVTDMYMPGMNGAELLREIARHHPLTVRMVLSGHSDEKSILSLVGTAHRFMAKPCDAQTLKSVLSRAFVLQTLLTDGHLQSLVSSLGSLPTIPEVYRNLTAKLQSQHATVREIGHLIGEDPPLTAKLLQLVNSAFFGVGRRISNPEEAASLLGLETLSGLILSAGIFRQFELDSHASSRISLETLWRRSISVGQLARDIARAEGCDQTMVDDSLASGLLHDIGRLLMAYRLPEVWDDIEQLTESESIYHWDAEQRLIGASHSALGAFLLGLWGLPDAIVEAVAFIHHPRDATAHAFNALTATHAADALVHNDGRLDEAYLQALGLSHRLEAWCALHDKRQAESLA